jgi:hypothetical protein
MNRSSQSQYKLLLLPLVINYLISDDNFVNGFQQPAIFSSKHQHGPTSTSRNVLEMEKTENEKMKKPKQQGGGPPNHNHHNNNNNHNNNNKKERGEILDPSTYEAILINSWDGNPSVQKGFDWEIEKLRRNSAGLQQLEDGTWVKRPSIFDFLVSKSRFSTAEVRRLDEPPKPVNLMDVLILFATNFLANIGFGPALGMAAVPDAVIQKYEGSFFSFIKGALGGDLQALAGGPLFLLLAKYYQDYGPIFNLSFGPKSFLVVSDPVMARHILRESKPDQYCKGILAEILEPIMGQGLIPADPATWKVRKKYGNLIPIDTV